MKICDEVDSCTVTPRDELAKDAQEIDRLPQDSERGACAGVFAGVHDRLASLVAAKRGFDIRETNAQIQQVKDNLNGEPEETGHQIRVDAAGIKQLPGCLRVRLLSAIPTWKLAGKPVEEDG